MKLDFTSLHKFCINLKRSSHRKQEVSKEFAKQCIEVEFFEAIDKNDLTLPEISVKQHESHATGILACAMSHLAVIKLAKERKLPAICIFEDDVVFCEDFKDRIKYIESLEDFTFDVFSLGGHYPDRNDWHIHCSTETKHKHIYKTMRLGGTYAYIISEKVYDFILRNWCFQYGIDELYCNFLYSWPQFDCYAMTPFLCGCAKTKSDITERDDWQYENIGWYYQDHEISGLVPKKDLRDVTFIIPVRIESFDREFNFIRCVKHLCDNFITTILIKESGPVNRVRDLLDTINKRNCKVEHYFEQDDGIFHRTKYLNELLAKSTTPVTVNYDADILLKTQTYILARNKIINDGYDLIYPYRNDPGDGQIQIKVPDKNNFTGDLFDAKYHSPWGSRCGHVQFFKTSSYREGGMENENFISYGPEDVERMERFQKIGYKVDWMQEHQVYHLEHERGINSSPTNPYFSANQALYNQLHNMSKEEVVEYYEKQEYIKKY